MLQQKQYNCGPFLYVHETDRELIYKGWAMNPQKLLLIQTVNKQWDLFFFEPW